MRPYYLLAVLPFLTGCGSEPPLRAITSPPAAMHVETAEVTETEWPNTYEATATVRARTTTIVSSKVMAYTREVRVQTGDRVREGQTLAVLDARDLDAALARTEAGREEVKSAIPEAESAIALAGTQLDLAQVTFDRMQNLMNQKSIANQEYDESLARWKAARAALSMARSKRTQLDAKLAQSEQEVRAAEIQRRYAEISAPFSGIIVAKSIEPGTLAVPGAPLFTIERAGAYRLEAAVEESRLAVARIGKTVSVTIDGVSGTFPARIAEVVPSVDSATRTGTVKLDLPAVPELRSGLFGRALFETGGRKVLSVPSESVMERGQLQTVFVAENNRARTRLVTAGTKNRGQVEVLSGLNPGDRVIVPVPTGLTDGAAIEVRQ
jgi:RND family efflux transporter MFP subunit